MIVPFIRTLAQRVPAVKKLKTKSVVRAWTWLKAHEPGAREYQRFQAERLVLRSHLYHARPEPSLLSFITTVWNTDPHFLRVLAESLLEGQHGHPDFEWVILDNGTTSPETLAELDRIAKDPRVKLTRAEDNLGIIGGMRTVLERATGRYVLPLDSDDYLYPDAVRIITWHIHEHDYPPLLYTDEDKLRGEVWFEAYFKSDWDPVLFINSCFIAHQTAIDRELALKFGAYDDADFEGCHDWDTFTRFLINGKTPVHVPEVVYSWRVHEASTSSGNMVCKPYVFNSQRKLVSKFVAAQPRASRFEVIPSPLFHNAPDWWIRRKREHPRPITTVTLRTPDAPPRHIATPTGLTHHDFAEIPVYETASALADIARAEADRGGLIHLAWDRMIPSDDEWAWEAIGHFELWPETVMIGGRTIDRTQHVVAAGAVFGFGRGCDCPDRGRHADDPGYFATMLKQRSVSAVSSQHCLIDAAFLAEMLPQLADIPVVMLGPWLGAEARRNGRRVIYSPFLRADAMDDFEQYITDPLVKDFVRENADVIPEDRYLSRRLGLDPHAAYVPIHDKHRREHLDRLAADAGSPARVVVGRRTRHETVGA